MLFNIFGRKHYGEHSCEIILNLDQRFVRRYHLKNRFMHARRRPTTIEMLTK